jgi:hypothetical protein
MARNRLTKWVAAACLACGMTLSNAEPQLAAFTYQGQLKQAGAPVNGARDLVFRLYGQAEGGQAFGAPVTADDYPVSDGLFMVDLSFPQAFTGEQLWLEIEVDGVLLTPRQPVMAAPVAQYALNGNPGPAGAQGETGPAGPMGPPGEAGPAGAQGPAGATGATGATGPKGDIGAAGSAGSPGETGPAGAQGPIGPAGPKGDVGAAGLQGVMGPKGEPGAAGPAGPQGAAGPAGAQGQIGPAGPKGDAGAAGAQGPAGPKGDTGPAGTQGPAGAKGDPGIKGDPGAIGPMGPQGAVGPAGAQGPAGVQGEAGPIGPQGEMGPAGPQGPGSIFSVADSTYKEVGIYIVSKTEPAGNSCASNMNCTYNAQCNPGDIALGGGIYASILGNTFNTTMRASYPGTDSSRWYFTIYNASFASATVSHYVSCIKFSN